MPASHISRWWWFRLKYDQGSYRTSHVFGGHYSTITEWIRSICNHDATNMTIWMNHCIATESGRNRLKCTLCCWRWTTSYRESFCQRVCRICYCRIHSQCISATRDKSTLYFIISIIRVAISRHSGSKTIGTPLTSFFREYFPRSIFNRWNSFYGSKPTHLARSLNAVPCI